MLMSSTLEVHVNEITQVVLHLILLLSSVMPLRLIHGFTIFLSLNSIPLYDVPLHLFHFPAEGHLSCFQLLVTMNKAAANIWFLYESRSLFHLAKYRGLGFLGHTLNDHIYIWIFVMCIYEWKGKWLLHYLITLVLFLLLPSPFYPIRISTRFTLNLLIDLCRKPPILSHDTSYKAISS